jgi:murein DD-endopeptidase MepM/ murein hydrolase activator NlpD
MQHAHNRATRRLAILLAAFVAATLAFAAGANPALAKPVTPKSGWGWIMLVSHTCGSSAGWEAIARANGSGPNTTPPWLLPLHSVNVTCPGTHEPKSTNKPATKPAAKPSVAVSGWGRPMACSAYWFSDFYGYPSWRGGAFHAGDDLAAPRGTIVRAAHSGTVKSAGWNGGYGNEVIVFVSGTKRTYYQNAHLSSIAVAVGDHVDRGDIIGRVGATGHVTGNHLHFGIMSGWKNYIDPDSFMRARGINLHC